MMTMHPFFLLSLLFLFGIPKRLIQDQMYLTIVVWVITMPPPPSPTTTTTWTTTTHPTYEQICSPDYYFDVVGWIASWREPLATLSDLTTVRTIPSNQYDTPVINQIWMWETSNTKNEIDWWCVLLFIVALLCLFGPNGMMIDWLDGWFNGWRTDGEFHFWFLRPLPSCNGRRPDRRFEPLT